MPNFSIALTGLKANSIALNTIGNNLANLNTTAYKSQTTTFADLYYQTIGANGSNTQEQVGTGTEVQSINTDYTQGTTSNATNSADMAINGTGFFVVQSGATQELTRAGNFQLDSTGNLVTADGLNVMGYPAKAGVVDTNASLTTLNIPTGATQSAKATSTVSFTENLDSTATVGTVATASTNVYDSLGTKHAATVTFTKTAANTWSYAFSLPSGESTAATNTTGTLTFDSNGKLTSPSANVPGIQFTGMADSASDMNFSWNLFDVSGNATVTQTSGASGSSATSQNGYASGTYQSFSVDASGVVSATFSNGQTQNLGQVAVATVANQAGLSRAGDNTYETTASSGQIAVGVAGSGGRGVIKGTSLEGSNVDISTEFANLIVAQRAFEANSKTVTTFDTITQDTIGMVR